MLEPELRPELLVGGTDTLTALPKAHRFEWIGGRLSAAEYPQPMWSDFWTQLGQHCCPGTGLRLLISKAAAGPAAALLQTLNTSSTPLEPLIKREEEWLEQQKPPLVELHQQGWTVTETAWSETVELGSSGDLIERWLGDGSAYRQAMTGLDEALLLQLRTLMKSLDGKGIRMPMQHRLLSGELTQKNPGEAGV